MKTDELLKNAGAAGAKAGLELNTAIGDRDLCAWRPVRGIWWVQTRNPRHAARLAKRKDGRLVATGVAGGFLRTFEFKKPAAWGARLLARYTAAENGAGGAFLGSIRSKANRTEKKETRQP